MSTPQQQPQLPQPSQPHDQSSQQPPQQQQPQHPPQQQPQPLWLPPRFQQAGPPYAITIPLPQTNNGIAIAESIKRCMRDCSQRVSNWPLVDVPPEDRHPFNQLLKPLTLQACRARNSIVMLCNLLQNDNAIYELISVICTINNQASMVFTAAHPPKYIVTLQKLKELAARMQYYMQFAGRPIGAAFNPKLQGDVPPTPKVDEQQSLQQQELHQVYEQVRLHHSQAKQLNALRAQQNARLQQQLQQDRLIQQMEIQQLQQQQQFQLAQLVQQHQQQLQQNQLRQQQQQGGSDP